MNIRRETEADLDPIRRINDLAFEGAQEGRLIDALRSAATPFISLVAEDNGELVGHICFTPVEVEREDGRTFTIAGLAPMAVLPSHQKQGVGAKLIDAGLDECRRAGFGAVVVLGHPEYYPRFGFAPASRNGLRSEYDVPDEAFMLMELVRGGTDELRGVARYHPAFALVE